MKTIRSYIDEAVQAGRIKNAAQLSVILNVKEATVSRWKSGDRVPNDDEAVKLAEAIGKEAGELLAECGAARAKTPETRQAWERIAARLAGGVEGQAVTVFRSLLSCFAASLYRQRFAYKF